MKKLLFIFVLFAAFAACSDDDGPDSKEPPSPIKSLVIPDGLQLTGDDVMLTGGGFAQGCKIRLHQEGSEIALEAVVKEITDVSLVFTTPIDAVGKYTLILVQGGESHELGEITFKLPIDDLVMPESPVAGENVKLVGKGFAEGCKIQLLAEGSETPEKVTIVEITETGIVFKSARKMGGEKYAVILVQEGKNCKLGELSFLKSDKIDGFYGVVKGDGTYDICPVNIKNQVIDDAIFTLTTDLVLEGIVADNTGKVYCRLVDENRLPKELHYFDIKTGEGGKINWANADKCAAIGVDNDELYALVLLSVIDDEMALVTVNTRGEEEVATEFSIVGEPGLVSNLYVNDGLFIVERQEASFGMEIDAIEAMDTYLYGVFYLGESFDVLDCESFEEPTFFRFVKIADNSYYGFQTTGSEDDGYETSSGTHGVFGEIWSHIEYRNPFDGEICGLLVYDEEEKMIYGMTNGRESILSFSTETNQPVARWEAGVSFLFSVPEGE